MTASQGEFRTERYRRDGVATVWITSQEPPWFAANPAIRVDAASEALHVIAGCAAWHRNWNTWVDPESIPFSRFATSLAAGRLVEHARANGRSSFVKPDDVKHESFHLATDARRKAARTADFERFKRAATAHRDRLAATTVAAIGDAERITGRNAWTGSARRPISDPTSQPIADPKFAHEAPIYVNTEAGGKGQLWAVACPVKSRIMLKHRGQWSQVNIYAATKAEAARFERTHLGGLNIVVVGDR